MSEPTCPTDAGAPVALFKQTLVLAFDLTGESLALAPERVAKILDSKEVAKAMNDAIVKEGKRLMDQQFKLGLTSDDAARAATAVGTAAAGATADEMAKQIKASAAFKAMSSKFQEFQSAFDQSPAGVFLESTPVKTTLYVVVAGAAIGGAMALYKTKTGQKDIVQAMTKLAASAISFKPMGGIEISVDGAKFNPKEQEVGGTLKVTTDWRAVKTEWKLGMSWKADRVVDAGASTEWKIAIKPDTTLNLSGGVQFNRPTVGPINAPGAPLPALSPNYFVTVKLQTPPVTGLGSPEWYITASHNTGAVTDSTTGPAGTSVMLGLTVRIGSDK